MSIARSERTFLISGVERDIRNDGRSRNTLRGFTLDRNCIEQASGACRVVAKDGGSHVLVGVKAEITPIHPPEAADAAVVAAQDRKNTTVLAPGSVDDFDQMRRLPHNKGRIACSVEVSPSVARFLDAREANELSTLYAEYMDRLLNGPSGVDLHSLCIIPESCCWTIRVDCLVLEYGGNLLDTLMVGVRRALADTLLPKVEIVESDGLVDFLLADEETEHIAGVEYIPVTVSFYKVGSRHVLDPTPLEEVCSPCQIAISVTSEGKAVLVEKFGAGGLGPMDLVEYLKIAKVIAPQLSVKYQFQ